MTIPKNILVATDFSPCSERAVSDAFELGAQVRATVHIVHAVEVSNMPDGAALAADAIAEAQQVAQQKMERAVARYRRAGRVGETVIRFGEPTQVILHVADELHIDLIALGTHGRKGLSRLLLGSVAESVVRHAHIAVMVTRSDTPAQPT